MTSARWIRCTRGPFVLVSAERGPHGVRSGARLHPGRAHLKYTARCRGPEAPPLRWTRFGDPRPSEHMSVLRWLLGRRLASDEQEQQQIGPLAGIPVLGLDALASAAYGPEAALTVLIPLGALGVDYIGPILAVIVGVLFIVYFSYRQTIAAYPGGGGSYTVAKANLGMMWGLTGGAALVLDYILNVAVGIAAGVGAIVSAFPSLLPHTLLLCLIILALLTVVNLRGVRESGLAFMAPTYAFIATLFIVMVVGVVKTLASSGHPAPIVAPPPAAERRRRRRCGCSCVRSQTAARR